MIENWNLQLSSSFSSVGFLSLPINAINNPFISFVCSSEAVLK